MFKYFNAYRFVTSRLLLSVFVLSVLLLTSGCGLFGAKKKIQVPQLLTPLSEASKDRLIQEVNRLSTVKSIHGKVDIQFEDTSFASSGVADQYRLVDGNDNSATTRQDLSRHSIHFRRYRADGVGRRALQSRGAEGRREVQAFCEGN